MSARKTTKFFGLSLIAVLISFVNRDSDALWLNCSSLAQNAIAKQLGWVPSPGYECGGYYVEPPFEYIVSGEDNDTVEITGGKGLISRRGTSVLEGDVVATRKGEQITANKAILYRDPITFKLTTVEMIGDVRLRQPNTLIVAKRGEFNFDTKAKKLFDIIYRTSLNNRRIVHPALTLEELQEERKITSLTAWGTATQVSQNEPRIYELYGGSFSTCPPINPTWRIKASHLVLNKNSGRGCATHARLYVKDIPIFYVPYLNFSIDRQRKSGFLWPTFGSSDSFGPYVLLPFYWNMAPNYDMTITTGYLSKRNFEILDNFRYLTTSSLGRINLNVLPRDRAFADFQESAKNNPQKFISPVNPPNIVDAELKRLEESSTTRRGFFWRDDSRYNNHWSSHIDFNYASDDYYLRDFGNNLNELTLPYLLQEADLYFESAYWNFTGRLQSYQTFHPVTEIPVLNQYRRLPQLILNGDYPDQLCGFDFFINNDATHFELLKNPGSQTLMPIGNRINVQPGISLPLNFYSIFINPRLQMSLTQYSLTQTEDMGLPGTIHRGIPIFDIVASTSLIRDSSLFCHAFQQTLEPQLYYTYIPFHNQNDIPLFDTTLSTLVYDQIFNYNRFSSIDRIGDANQLAAGITSRFLDETGTERARLGLGEIFYFAKRRVNLCVKGQPCPDNPADNWRLSPLTGLLKIFITPTWSFSTDAIWNPISKQLDNTTVGFQYHPDSFRLINLGYSFVRNGDIFRNNNVTANNPENNLKMTTVSFTWPIIHDIEAVGNWSQDWHSNHFQNLLFGLQYDTCCWATRLVGGKIFTNLFAKDNTPQYNTTIYIEFALKGLGNIGTGNPSKLLSSISGYSVPFGQEL